MIVSSLTAGSNNPNSFAGLFVARNAVRGVRFAAANNPCKWDLVHPTCMDDVLGSGWVGVGGCQCVRIQCVRIRVRCSRMSRCQRVGYVSEGGLVTRG